MKKTFLYQLYQYNKASFWLVAVFICCYTILFVKKMDMAIFPHNSMFAGNNPGGKGNAATYALKVNDTLVNISSYPYWKKDFLESSIATYSTYIQNGNRVSLEDYFNSGKSLPAGFTSRLLPSPDEARKWLVWLASFTGRQPGSHAGFSLYRFHFDFSSGAAVLKDSILLYTQRTKSFK